MKIFICGTAEPCDWRKMNNIKLHVELLRYTPKPEEIVAMAAKQCYSKADLDELKDGIESRDLVPFIEMLVERGHMSTMEHASFTFGIEGFPVRCLLRSQGTA